MSTAVSSYTSPYSQRPQKKQKMGITQTYFLAHTARGKLSKEASRADHDLRLLVGHANLLDTLMLDLANAEQEQENWFNQTVSAAKEEEKSSRHIQWADATVEQIEDLDSSDSDSDDEAHPITARTVTISKPELRTTVTTRAISEDDEEEDEDEDSEELALTRTTSHHPPGLSSDSDDDSEDETMPPSPPTITLDVFSEKQRQAIATTSFYDRPAAEAQLTAEEQADFFEDGFFLPSRTQPAIITAY